MGRLERNTDYYLFVYGFFLEGQAENENVNAIKKDDIIANNVVVKREASAEARKREGKNGRPRGRKKNKAKKSKKRNNKRKVSKKGAKNKGRRERKKGNKGRKGKRKSNKGKKGARKHKKQRNSKSKRKSKKGKKNKKRKSKIKRKKEKQIKSQKIRKSNARKISRQTTNYTSCVEKFIEYSRLNELKARSIEMQVNRINSFKGIKDKKKGKKGDFKGTYNTLLSALGGNESSPECDGKPINGSSRSAKYKGMTKHEQI